MNVKFICPKCKNEEDITISASSPDLIQNIKPVCSECGGDLQLKDLDELVHQLIEIQIAENVDRWLKTIGGDETLSMIQRNSHLPYIDLYKDNLRARGFIIK